MEQRPQTSEGSVVFLSQQQSRVAAVAIAVAIGLALVMLTGGPKPTPPAPPGPPPERTLDVTNLKGLGLLKLRDWSTTSPAWWLSGSPIEEVPITPWNRPHNADVLIPTGSDVTVPAGKELLLVIQRVRVARRPTIWTRLLGAVRMKPGDQVSVDLSFLRDLEPGDLQGLAIHARSDASSLEKSWFRRNIGPLRWLKALGLSNKALGDFGLDFLDHMTSLEDLDLSRNVLNDNDLAHLAHLTSLRRLVLSSNPIDGHGLARLKDLNSLEVLDLSYTSFNDAAAVHLENLASLRKLYLSFTEVTDDALPSIGKLTSLVDLDLFLTAVEGPGLVHLKNLRALKRLALWTVNDPDDLAALADLPALEEFDLGITRFHEGHIAVLKAFPSLRKLRLRATYARNSVRWKLKEALPACEIIW